VETAVAATTLEELTQSGQIVRLGQQLLTRGAWETARDRLLQNVNAYHRDYPLRSGAPREELRSRLRLPVAVFNPLVNQTAAAGLLVAEEARLRAPNHAVTFSAAQQAAVDALLRAFTAAGVNAPSVKEARAAVGDELYNALVELGRLRPLTNDVVYAAPEYARFTHAAHRLFAPPRPYQRRPGARPAANQPQIRHRPARASGRNQSHASRRRRARVGVIGVKLPQKIIISSS
jgi:selenocysteine-specific elongation factor